MDYVIVDIENIKRTTDRAVLAEINGDEYWIPRSVIEDGEDLEEGDSGEIEVAEWFVQKEDLG